MPIILNLLALAFVAVPLSGYAQVSTTQEAPVSNKEIAPRQTSIFDGDRLKGTVEYNLQNGNGKGESVGQAENVQGPDYPQNWVPVGANSQGVVRYGSPVQPDINKGQIMLKLQPGQKLPPTDIGNPIFRPSADVYGSEDAPPPFSEFTRIDDKPSGVTFGQGILKDIQPWPDANDGAHKPAPVKSPATGSNTNGSNAEK